jgi:chitodextrinase
MTGGAGAPAGGAPSGGATGGTGCSAPAWVSGNTYKAGDVVTAVCNAPGGGQTVCTTGKKYPWTCFGAQCTIYGAGADAWWANWNIGAACN